MLELKRETNRPTTTNRIGRTAHENNSLYPKRTPTRNTDPTLHSNRHANTLTSSPQPGKKPRRNQKLRRKSKVLKEKGQDEDQERNLIINNSRSGVN